jgi:hypothetical protein
MTLSPHEERFSLWRWFDECWNLSTWITPFFLTIFSRFSPECALELSLIRSAGTVSLGFSGYTIAESRSSNVSLGHKNGLVCDQWRPQLCMNWSLTASRAIFRWVDHWRSEMEWLRQKVTFWDDTPLAILNGHVLLDNWHIVNGQRGPINP